LLAPSPGTSTPTSISTFISSFRPLMMVLEINKDKEY
jgi:hypothetical protein